MDGGTNWAPDWTDVPDGSDSGSDQGDERTVTVTSLANGSLYTFQVRAVNSEGSGSEIEATATPNVPVSIVAPASTDATLSALALRDASDNAVALSPAFASGATSYSATVANSVSRIKVEPTANDSNATIEYLDDSDATLPDEDTSTADVLDVDLSAGSNVVKVKVTAGDGTTTRTYTVTVTRQAALPNRAPTGQPTISGTPQVGQMLTASTSGINDADGLTDRVFSYQWVRVDGVNEADISGATSQTYLLTNDDQDLKIKVVVSFVDDRGEAESVSSRAFPGSGNIQPKPNSPPTGSPTITGQAEVGHTLIASTSGIVDIDGLNAPGFTYQWQRQDGGVFTDIAGATGMLYTLTSDDEDKRVRVEVTFTDDDGNRHTLTSAPTGTVQALTSIPSDKVEVSLGATAYEVEEGDTLQIPVTLAEAHDEDGRVIIPFTLTPAGGATTADFMAKSSYFRLVRFYAGETTERIKIMAVDDTLDDDGESLTLCLGDLPEPYAVLPGKDCATIVIIDNDDPNSVKVSFGSRNYYASEDGNPAWPRISVHPVPDREITIPITFTRGGGLSAADHSTVTTSVTFGPGLYGEHGDGHLSDNRTYASFPIEIWATDDDQDDDGEYMDLAFGTLPPFVSQETTNYRGYTESRVWFHDNDFTEVTVTNRPNIFRPPAGSGSVSRTPSWRPQRAISSMGGLPPCASGWVGTATWNGRWKFPSTLSGWAGPPAPTPPPTPRFRPPSRSSPGKPSRPSGSRPATTPSMTTASG